MFDVSILFDALPLSVLFSPNSAVTPNISLRFFQYTSVEVLNHLA